MKHIFSKFTIGTLLLIILAGCTSSSDKQRQVEAIASHRAKILSNELPIEHGPLTIMQARAKANVVELMMIYNGDNAIPPKQLMDKSLAYYCSNNEVKANLEHGVIYDIKMRSPRGQLLFEKVISLESCSLEDDESK